MLYPSRNKNANKLYSGGFSLIELLVVSTILCILVAGVVPTFINCIEKVKIEVCIANCFVAEKNYDAYLLMQGTKHSGTFFQKYMLEYGKNICPEGGNIYFANEGFYCDIHNPNATEENDNDGSVPFL